MGRTAIRDMFARTKAEGRAAFLPFMTAGLPTPQESLSLFQAMADAGADGFEVGIPYTDPLMDGPVIQRGSDTAIRAGATLDVSVSILESVASATSRPTIAMTYVNPIFRRGVDRFCEELAAAGADALIVPDLPVDESQSLRIAAERHGLGVVLFVAPTSDAGRIEAVAAADPVFIYAVAEMGVTGERTESGSHVEAIAERVRKVTDAPIVFGVGISNPEQAAAAGRLADGVIVGSALVRRALEAESVEAACESLAVAVSEISQALRA
ncbi:MAG TPA: tryptophan synthase subunit alpha [Acidimicrobiia bacterium]